MEFIKTVLQSLIIINFMGLTLVGFLQHDWNLGFLLNLGLVILYVALWWRPL